MTYDESEEQGVTRPGAKRPVEPVSDGAGLSRARVDGASVVVGARVGFRAAAHPLGGAAKAVEVRVAHDRVHLADALDDRRGDHLGARAVLCLGREDEARVVLVARMENVVVMVHPAGEARAELLDEGQSYLLSLIHI